MLGEAKTCTRCLRTLPLSEFRRRKNYNGTAAIYRVSECKDCLNERYAQYRQTAEGKAAIRRGIKKYEQTEKGRVAREKAMRTHNAKPERKAYNAALEALPSMRKKRRDYRRSEAGKASITSYNHRRRARLRSVQADLSREEWSAILEAANGRCAYCGHPAEKLTLDHIVAIANGGAHTKTNVVAACEFCNYSKGAKDARAWIGEMNRC